MLAKCRMEAGCVTPGPGQYEPKILSKEITHKIGREIRPDHFKKKEKSPRPCYYSPSRLQQATSVTFLSKYMKPEID